jgi:hypothetical protein
MRQLFLPVAVCLAAVALIVPAASAESPHFIGTPSCSKSLSSGLTCSGKASGLGNGPTAAFLTADSVNATYECVNHGGNVAPGQPVVSNAVVGPTETITPRNGTISFSPTIPVPTPPSAASDCPSGKWTVRLTSLTYENVVLHLQQPPGTDVLTFDFGTIDP